MTRTPAADLPCIGLEETSHGGSPYRGGHTLVASCPNPRYVRPGGKVEARCLEHLRELRRIRRARDANLRASEAVWARNAALRRKYGIEPEDYVRMAQEQLNRCAICGREMEPGELMVVDHDHKTGKLRELLCDACNRGLGFFRDNPASLHSAASYVESHR